MEKKLRFSSEIARAWAFRGNDSGRVKQKQTESQYQCSLLDWSLINQQSFRWERGEKAAALSSRSVGSTAHWVFPIAATFNRKNSIQNFPHSYVSLLIYLNSLLLLFARGNQWLPVPAARISKAFTVSLSLGVLHAEQTTTSVLTLLEVC